MGLISLMIFSSFNLKANEIVIGKQHSFSSLILQENRELQVYVPESYAESNKHYPVLFVMDSQRYFLHAIAHQQTLRFQDKTPELIVVGLKTDSKNRRQWLYPKREQFINFLAQELIPWIDKHYRTSDERLYFGWEMAAGIVPDLLTKQPNLFQGFFMASPTHINKNRIAQISQYLQHPTAQHFIYATLGTVETWASPSMAALEQVVKKQTSNSIDWEYHLLEDQDHYTTPLLTIDNGLLKFYSDYGPLRFYSIKEFEQFGGLQALKSHYNARGERFGISAEIHDDTKHYLLNQSLKENNLNLFAKLENSFEGFIEKYYVVDFWFVRLANAFDELDQLDNVERVLSIGLSKVPDSHLLYASLAKLRHKQANNTVAKEFYNKAIKLAKNDDDARQKYQSEISKLK